MRKIILAVCLMLSVSASAQKTVHTDSSLNTLAKGELVKIYISQVNELAEKLPYSVWGYSDDLQGVDIPKKSKYLYRKQRNMTIATEIYMEDNQIHMPEVIHYADKKRLINVILYLQDVNSKIARVE